MESGMSPPVAILMKSAKNIKKMGRIDGPAGGSIRRRVMQFTREVVDRRRSREVPNC